jgi:lanthanide-dependent methanol dehydrogenase
MRPILPAALAVFLPLMTAPAAHANDTLNQLSKDPKQWVMQLGNYAGHRYSALDQINEGNASKLQVAWMFSTGVLRGHAGGPLVIGNMMYLVTPFPNNVIALNLDSDQQIVWTYRPKQDPATVSVMCCDTVNRGLAYADGTIYFQQSDTSVLALDAATGKERWKIVNGDPKRGETATAAPLVVKDKVIVGISGGEFGGDCHLTSLDRKTGKQAWRAYAVGPDERTLIDPDKTTVLGKPVGKETSLSSWKAEDWPHAGACAWGAITYDPELNLIYYGTGNPAPWNSSQRPGDNKWASSIIARDADTGVARWIYQLIPHDQWGYDATAENILVDMDIDGAPRNVLQHFDANGFAYVLDRATGMLLKADKFDTTINWTKSVDVDPASATYGRPVIDPEKAPETLGTDANTINICPAKIGAKGAAPASWHAPSGRFVVPIIHTCMDKEPQKVPFTPGQPYVGALLSQFPPKGESNEGLFSAWSSPDAKVLWSANEPFSVTSGPLVTAGNVVFYGTLEGTFKAVRLKDGKELYKFKVGSGIVGNPMTYEHKGKQYVAVLSGIGGYAAIRLAADLEKPSDGFPAFIPACGLSCHVRLGGNLVVFALP